MPSGYSIQYVSNLEDPAVATGLETVNPQPNPKKGSTKECANHWTIALISHASKVLLKILHAGFNIMWTKNFQMSKLGLEKGRGTRDQMANICWIIEKAREFQKNIYLYFIDYAK